MRELDLSERALARRWNMSTATLNRVTNNVGVIAEETLRQLANHLNMQITEVRELAGLPRGEIDPFVIDVPPEFDRLTADERNLLRSTLLTTGRLLLVARSDLAQPAPESTGGSVTELRQSERPRVKSAARRRPADD